MIWNFVITIFLKKSFALNIIIIMFYVDIPVHNYSLIFHIHYYLKRQICSKNIFTCDFEIISMTFFNK